MIKLNSKDKDVAVKQFKLPVPAKQLLTAVVKLKELSHDNIVEFLGFSSRPSSIMLELCQVNVDGKIVSNVAELIDLFDRFI